MGKFREPVAARLREPKLVRTCRRYIRGRLGKRGLTGSGCDPQLIRRSLTATGVDNEFVGYFLALSETAKARAFNGADMNENVPSA